jgi:hypothetical protein
VSLPGCGEGFGAAEEDLGSGRALRSDHGLVVRRGTEGVFQSAARPGAQDAGSGVGGFHGQECVEMSEGDARSPGLQLEPTEMQVHDVGPRLGLAGGLEVLARLFDVPVVTVGFAALEPEGGVVGPLLNLAVDGSDASEEPRVGPCRGSNEDEQGEGQEAGYHGRDSDRASSRERQPQLSLT